MILHCIAASNSALCLPKYLQSQLHLARRVGLRVDGPSGGGRHARVRIAKSRRVECVQRADQNGAASPDCGEVKLLQPIRRKR